jgi:hypothetical protein
VATDERVADAVAPIAVGAAPIVGGVVAAVFYDRFVRKADSP